MASPIAKYGFINAKLRTRLSKILNDDFIYQVVRAASLPEAVLLFANTNYAFIESIYSKTGDVKLIERELFNSLVKLYTEIEQYVDKDVLGIVHALATKFETENLKNVLRLWFDKNIRKRDISTALSYLYREPIHYNLNIDTILNTDSIEMVIDALQSTPYSQIIRENSQYLIQNKNLFRIEIGLDHYYYKELLEEAHKLDAKDKQIATRLIGVSIDMHNINWVVRFKTAYNLPIDEALNYCIPSGYNLNREAIAQAYKSESVTEILSEIVNKKYPGFQTLLSNQAQDTNARLMLVERILSLILSKEVSRALCGYPFSVGIILAYFILKENEIKKIMTILNAKYYGIAEDRIMSGL